ncbi:MAG: ATP-binding cassette domain-containing protein [Alphaproteobacteria bacterium]|jgi:ATP-binding cassette subfamily C protein LapB|nr:ATP-binding cassette domain-containing protein [Alphaproteobacteria bacterium]
MTKPFNYYDCVMPLLQALGWHGHARRIFEAVPYLSQQITLLDFRNLMANLGYVSKSHSINLKVLPESLLPCLFIANSGGIYVLSEREDGVIKGVDCQTNEKVTFSETNWTRGTIYTFYQEPENATKRGTWISNVMIRFHTFIYWLIGLGCLTSILSLSSILFVMAIYDEVVPSRSGLTLGFFALGLVLALCCIQFVHVIHNKALAYLGARLDMIVGIEVLRHIINLPMSLIEGASVASQVARLRQFDSVRETFTGPIAQILLEGPFMIIFLVIIFMIAGPIVLIPIFMIFVFTVFTLIMAPIMRRSTQQTAAAAMERRTFLLEGTSHLSTIKNLGAEKTWVDRFQDVSASLSVAQKHTELLSSLSTNISQMIMKIAGLSAIVWGAIRVTDNLMSVGALMAVVLLVWRALSPLQSAFMILGRVDQIMDSLDKINRLMLLPTERRHITGNPHRFEGLIRVQNVGFRYANDPNPAVQGIMMEAKPGEIVAIVGQNGSGKTTLIKLLLGFYYPQAGSIMIDGIDIRQFDPYVLRQSIAYVPQQNQFFHGTLAQNLQFSAPEATEERMIEAAKQAGLLSQIMALPEGFETRIDEQLMTVFSSGFLQKLNLARAYVRKSNIMIMDEPGNTLDKEGDDILRQTIESFRGKKTILLVTHRPSLVNMADRILSLQGGTMRVFGPKDKVLGMITGDVK